jgi:inhibitor of cysteine peptidase
MYKISALALSTALIFSSVSIPAFADQTVRIPQNQNTFTLQLNANATTGFQWFLENYNPTYFTYLGYHYIAPQQPKSGPKIMGAPGMAQFTFQVNPAFHQGPLTSTIHLVYGQPWDMTANTGTTITLVSQPLDSSDLSSRTAINQPLPPTSSDSQSAQTHQEKLSTATTESSLSSTSAPTQNSMHSALLSDSSDDDSTPNMATVTSPAIQEPSENLTDGTGSNINSPPLSAATQNTQNTQPTQTMKTTTNTPASVKNNPAQNWLSLPSSNTDKTGS